MLTRVRFETTTLRSKSFDPSNALPRLTYLNISARNYSLYAFALSYMHTANEEIRAAL